MDLGKWLRDRKKDVEKRWQNSTVLDAVSANTQADKARRAAQGTPQTVNQQAANTYGSGLSAPVNRVKDLFQADTQADQMKRIAETGLTETYDQQQKRLTDEALNTQTNRSLPNQFSASGLRNIINRVAKIPGDSGNVAAAVLQSDNPFVKTAAYLNPIAVIPKLTDDISGGRFSKALQSTSQGANKLVDNKLGQSQLGDRKNENKWAVGGGQLITDLPFQAATGGLGSVRIGVGTASDEYNKARATGKSNDYALGTGLLQGGASALSEKIGMDRFLPGNNVAGNFAVKASKRFLTEGLQEAQQQFTQNLIANKSYDPNQGLKDGVVESAVLGGLAGGAMSPVLDFAGNAQPKAPQQVKQKVVEAKPVLQQTGIPARPGSIRERIQVAKDTVTNKIANNSLMNDEAGALRNPFAKQEVAPAQPRMRVEERAALEAYMDLKRGTGEPLTPREQAIVVRDAKAAADRLGIPFYNGTGLETMNIDNFFNNNRIPQAPVGVETPKPSLMDKLGLKSLNQGGYAKNPFYDKKNDIAKAIKNIELEIRKEQSTSMSITGDADADAAIERDSVRNYLRSKPAVAGDATTGEGAQLPSKGMTKEQKQALIDKARAKVDPLESLKQEARKYKSVEEYSAAILERAKKEYGETFTDANAYLEGQQRLAQGGNYAAIADRSDPISQSTKLRTVYRGSPSGKSFHLVHGDFLAPTKSEAAAYGGVVKELQIPENQLVSGGKNSYIYKNKAKAAPEPMSLTDLYNQATLKDNQSGSVQIPKVLTNISERIRNSSLAKNEGGYAKNPFYDKKNDIAQDLTPEQSDFINQYANMLEDMGSGNGVTVNPETNQRVSSNYRNPELGSGKVSKAEWFDQARKEIESGKGIYGASEDYKALQTTNKSKIDEDEAFRQELRAQGMTVPDDYVQNKPTVTMDNLDLKRLKTDPDYQREVNDSMFAVGQPTKEALMKEYKKIFGNYDKPTQKSSSKTKSPKPPVQDLPSISNRIAESKQQAQTEQSPVDLQETPTTASSVDRSSNMAKDTPIDVNTTTKQGKTQDYVTVKDSAGKTIKIPASEWDAEAGLPKEMTRKPTPPKPGTDQYAEMVDNLPTKGDALSPENFAKTFGGTTSQAKETLDAPRFDAVTRTDKGKDANKLFESMKTDAKINQATKEAQASGKELNFYAKKDSNDRSVGIEQFNPKTQHIEAGFVVDENQNILGNHIKVDANGIQVNVGGKVVNMESILGNPLDWGNTPTSKSKKAGYRLSETMNRNIDNNAPNTEIANKTKNFLWSNKVKAEADMRTELEAEYKALGNRIKKTNKAKPLNVSSKQWKDDIFSVLNGDKTDAQIQETYGQKAQAILDYKKETRTLYDSLLKRVNVERVKFGQPEIQARKDYITHLQELNGSKNFVAEVYGQMKNSFADEGMGKTRNGVPGEIAGRTENFKPISKYNPFLQRRTGTKSERDPYMAVQEYLQPALYNIHMTESGARARAIESAFRTAEAIRNTEPRTLLDEAKKITDKYQTNSDNAKLITGFQEYANAIAGKTQRFDRQVVDSSDAAAKGLKGWQRLQKTGGQATILGNASSILAQPLNQVVGLADAGPINYMKGISAAVAGDPAIEKSAFVRARETEPTKAIRKTGEKVLDAGSIPLQKVELASVKLMWHTQHQKALSQGLGGQEAIQQADLNTERLVAGRGIADKPELYRSTVANGVLQYTLEVNASNKTFWKDLSPKQKATFLVASTATNTLMGAVTGFEPLPDFLKALFETGKDILNTEDDKNIAQNLIQGGQRMLDQYATMNPLVGAPANLLPQAQRKAIFGQDSDTGRFSGSTAPVQVVTNAVKAASDLTKGNYTGARDNILRDVPFGNQIRKTVTGAEMINRGYAVDSSGKKTFDSPTSPLGKAQALVFGPSATKPAREYYDNKSTSKSSSSVSTKDAQGNETTTDDFETISKATFNNAKGKEFMALTNDDARKEFARQSPDNRAIYDDYKALQKAYNGGDKLLAPGLDETSTKTLNKYDRMTPKAKENIFNSKPNAEYEYELAAYSNKKANGETNLVDEINTQQKLSKLKATKDFQKGYRDLYSGLSKAEVYDLITSNPDGKKIAEQLLAIDDALVKVGNKSKFRDKYGNVDFDPARAKSGGRGGSKSDGTLAANSLRTDTLQRLNALLAGTQKPVTGYKRAASSKLALKKITVKK